METAPLKSFATWARTVLTREVSARISIVLASLELRQEQPKAIAALERAVKEAGGGYGGRDTVADKVAYTWFNRIIALRFMDANGYTGVGVVSPEHGRAGGQPEILSDANRGNIDPEIVRPAIAHTVTGLLNGTRRSADPLGEAYAMLLAEYCRHWNRAMPFMFEPEGDYTELLIPSNLLADDSVLARAQVVLGEEVCRDVEVIGWLYQFYISEKKDEVFAGFKKNKKAGAAEIPAATQLFTPHWIVRYLVENSLGRLWLLNRPTSRLADRMDYYIKPVETECDFLKVSGPEELKVMDPACGSGHMLTYAFDLLYAIYEEEGYAPSEIPGLILAHNLYGTEIDPRAGALAAFALTMKARERQRTFFSKQIDPSICVLEPVSFTPPELDLIVTRGGDRTQEEAFWNQFEQADTFGSLIRPREELIKPLRSHLGTNVSGDGDLFAQDILERGRRVVMQAEYLSQRYHVVVANPPYMGMKNASTILVEFLKESYSKFKSDLFSAFVYRSNELSATGGFVGIMSPNVWMYISAHSNLRRLLLDECGIQSLIELPLGGFDGATVQICAYTFTARRSGDEPVTFVRLTKSGHSASDYAHMLRQAVTRHDDPNRFVVARSAFRGLPGEPLIYWMADKIAPAFANGSSLSDVAYTRIGLITGDNASYIREWYEVSSRRIGEGMNRGEAANSGLRWFPISKGGEFRKWYGNVTAIVDWGQDGKKLQTRMDVTGSRVLAHNFNLDDIFREGVTWSKISSGRFSGRFHPAGHIFNDPSANIFPSDKSVSVYVLLAFLSSDVADLLLRALNPTLNFQPGNVASLPWPATLPTPRIEDLAQEALSIARADWNEAEVSQGFVINRLVLGHDGESSLRETLDKTMFAFSERAIRLAKIEQENNSVFSSALGLESESDPFVAINNVTLSTNVHWAFGQADDLEVKNHKMSKRMVEELVSYAVGCMFGRYSLDEPGLILANQGDTLRDYLARVPNPSFAPDADNVIPIVGGDWFEDDIVDRFRLFLRVAFGEQYFEENLRFVTESLGVKDLRDYFVKSFYKDHLQRYKKRPIYWLFSSPKGSFNALIYMHRYTPSTVSTVLNEYLREYTAKLEASRQQQVRLVATGGTAREMAAAQKEVDRLRKVLLELEEYEHDVLHPLAQQQVHLDLDDGVKANYPKLGAALKKIPGLEATNE